MMKQNGNTSEQSERGLLPYVKGQIFLPVHVVKLIHSLKVCRCTVLGNEKATCCKTGRLKILDFIMEVSTEHLLVVQRNRLKWIRI